MKKFRWKSRAPGRDVIRWGWARNTVEYDPQVWAVCGCDECLQHKHEWEVLSRRAARNKVDVVGLVLRQVLKQGVR